MLVIFKILGFKNPIISERAEQYTIREQRLVIVSAQWSQYDMHFLTLYRTLNRKLQTQYTIYYILRKFTRLTILLVDSNPFHHVWDLNLPDVLSA